MTNVNLRNVEVVNLRENTNTKSMGENLINVNVYKNSGSYIGQFNIDFLIDLLGKIASEKNYSFDNYSLVQINESINSNLSSVQCKDICLILANKLAYEFSLFVKYLADNEIDDFDWFNSYKCTTDDNSSLVIYGINNVISKVRNSISMYCERVGGNYLKQYFLSQLQTIESSHVK